MVNEKFMMVSLEDPKMKSLSDVLGNKTCKKIIDYLAENAEASQKDLSDALSIAINTIEYNIKKLVESGLVQKRKNFFWSKKGKKIVMYELSNKSIVISPRRSVGEKLLKILPAVIVTGALTFGTYVFEKFQKMSEVGGQMTDKVMAKGMVAVDYASEGVMEMAMDAATPSLANSQFAGGASDVLMRSAVNHVSDATLYTPSNTWVYFMAGGLLALFVYSLINWKRL